MAIPEGFKEATFVFTVSGNTRQMTFSIGIADLDIVTPRSNAELAELMAVAWSASDGPFISSNMPAEYRFEGVTVTEMTSTGPLVAHSEHFQQGTGAQAVPPINCALLVTKLTAEGGRRNKGRMYIPPFLPSESGVDVNGNINSSNMIAISGQINAARGRDLANDITYLLYHQSGDPTPTAITALSVSSLFATQRRRMRG